MHAWINLSHPGFSGRADKPDDGDEWISWEEMAKIVKEHKEPEQLAAEVQRLRSAVDFLGKFSESAVFVIADLSKGGPATGAISASDAGQWAIHEDGSVFHIEPGKPGPEGQSWTLACAARILKTREAEKRASRVSSVDRFASCPKNQPCTPVGCEAGGGEWPRCPKEEAPPKEQKIQQGPGPRPTVCPSPAPPPKCIDGSTLVAYRSALALAEWASKNPIDDAWRASFADVQRYFNTSRATPTRAGEGMVAVSRCELDALNQIASSVVLPPNGCARILDIDWSEAANGRRNLDSLRSNQGGAKG